jgi:hypothetical protein
MLICRDDRIFSFVYEKEEKVHACMHCDWGAVKSPGGKLKSLGAETFGSAALV